MISLFPPVWAAEANQACEGRFWETRFCGFGGLEDFFSSKQLVGDDIMTILLKKRRPWKKE